MVEELPEERRARGHVVDVLVDISRAELRFGDQPYRTLAQRVSGVQQPARLADVDHRVPDGRDRGSANAGS
ncbi:MAG: hypothetical protein ACRDS0_00780 [Pseudonocardiaceae bacterium]